jgi:hypothetical protein
MYINFIEPNRAVAIVVDADSGHLFLERLATGLRIHKDSLPRCTVKRGKIAGLRQLRQRGKETATAGFKCRTGASPNVASHHFEGSKKLFRGAYAE